MANKPRFDADFTITDVENISNQYETTSPLTQVPFSLATKGILFRNRNKPYLVSNGGNPDDIIT
jgi:hypothetical protein